MYMFNCYQLTPYKSLITFSVYAEKIAHVLYKTKWYRNFGLFLYLSCLTRGVLYKVQLPNNVPLTNSCMLSQWHIKGYYLYVRA